MLIEMTTLLKLPVYSSSNIKLGVVDRCLFDETKVALAALQVARAQVLTKFLALNFNDILSLSRQAVIVDNEKVLTDNLGELDELKSRAGAVLGVRAKTESGKSLGRISDVLIEGQTGGITRFYLRQFLSERIIPRQYLVAITPEAVIFKDVVEAPVFNQLASAKTVSG